MYYKKVYFKGRCIIINLAHSTNNTVAKFGFVILHYLAFDATVECVESIYHCLEQDDLFEIVIVDNGSPNGTGKLLKTKYEEHSNIHVLLLDNNIGFAKGNNCGFQFAKRQLKCNFICMLNNDTILKQQSFIDKCYEIYQQYPYAVIGPMIIRKDSTVQSPNKNIRSRKFYILYRNILKIELLLSQMGLDTVKITEILLRLKNKRKKTITTKAPDYDHPRQNLILHGCCWIFTPQFIERFEGINNKTFLYREEELLYILLTQNNLNNLYTPELQIYHMEDIATDMITNTPKRKRAFIYKNEIASLKILIDEMKKNSKL